MKYRAFVRLELDFHVDAKTREEAVTETLKRDFKTTIANKDFEIDPYVHLGTDEKAYIFKLVPHPVLVEEESINGDDEDDDGDDVHF